MNTETPTFIKSENYKYITTLDVNKLGKYRNNIKNNNVILTNERRNHILSKHLESYILIINNIKNTIENPDYIIEDINHNNTILIIKKLVNHNSSADSYYYSVVPKLLFGKRSAASGCYNIWQIYRNA